MLEYFSHKKIKRHQAEKDAAKTPVLSDNDEQYLEHIVSNDTSAPLSTEAADIKEAGDATDNDAQVALADEKGKGKNKPKSNRFSFLQRAATRKVCLRVLCGKSRD